MMDKGIFEAGVATSDLKILSGSGTDELESISGLGRYSADANSSVIELHYALHSSNGSVRQNQVA